MDTALLSKTAAAMVAKGKGILAADESSGTCETRFKSVGVECTEENRRTYRGLLFTTPGVEQYISGVILFDETIRQKTNDGVPFPQYLAKKGIIPGIKVDAGAKNLPLHPGEKVTEGLDGLPKRLEEYFKLGARFAKWRAVITIGPASRPMPASMPTPTRSRATPPPARRPRSCRSSSPRCCSTATTIERSEEVTEATLRVLPRRTPPTTSCPSTSSSRRAWWFPARTARSRLASRSRRAHGARAQAHSPGLAARVVFLSGGQSDEAATAHLNAMASMKGLPWPLTFSYSRALQNPALKTWKGQAGNIAAAQKAFFHRAHMNGLAAQGKWRAELEKQAA